MKKTVLLLTSVFVLMLGLVGCSSSDKGVENTNVQMVTVKDVKGGATRCYMKSIATSM